MGRRVLAVGVGAAMALALAASVLAASGTVAIKESNDKYLFAPQKTYVNVGDSVTWDNGTDAPHTVTSDGGGELASSTIAADGKFSHTFSKAGTFAYHCTIHPYMTGEIIVLAAGVTPPATDSTTSRAASSESPLTALTGLVVLGLAAGLLLVRRAGRLQAR